MKPVDVVVQGRSDIGRRLPENELQQALNLCGKLFASTGPDEYRTAESLLAERFKDGVADNAGPEITDLRFPDVQTPAINSQIIEIVVRGHPPSVQRPVSDIGDTVVDFRSNPKNPAADLGCEELDMKAALEEVNARRALQCGGCTISRKSRRVDRVQVVVGL